MKKCSAYSDHCHTILQCANVLGVGSGYKIVRGMQTNTQCVAVFVSKKCPVESLPRQDVIPHIYKGFNTDVIEIEEFQAFGFTNKKRPVVQGFSIGVAGLTNVLTGGSAGCLVYDKSNPTIRYILSSNHVLVNNNLEPIGTPILQPTRLDSILKASQVATLSRYIPILFTTLTDKPINYVDCAIARLLTDDMATPSIAHIGIPTGVALPSINLPVVKSGRTTGFTRGTIQYTNATVQIKYGSGKLAIFDNQIITTAMSGPGDSGAALVNPATNKIIGLLAGGSKSRTIYNPIQEVLNALDVALVTSQ